MLSEVDIENIKKNFFSNAESEGLDISESSSIRPILNFVYFQKKDTIEEINSISKNYDIRKSTGLFLDLEAIKLGIKREKARKARIQCRLCIKGGGFLKENTIFEHESTGNKYRTLSSIQYKQDEDLTVELEAIEVGIGFNTIKENEKLITSTIIPNLAHLEFTKYLEKGRDEETDDEFRSRILGTIATFSLRDTPKYFSELITKSEAIREVYIERTPQNEANTMKIVLRGLNENTECSELEQEAEKLIKDDKPYGVKITYEKAVPKEISVKLEKIEKTKELNDEKIKENIESYFDNLKLGDSYSIYQIYSILGEGINITSPIKNQKAENNQYFKAKVEIS